MKKKENYIKINGATVVLAVLLMIGISANVTLYMMNDRVRSEIKMSDLKGNQAELSICTASIDSMFYICSGEKNSWGYSIYNMTQKQMDSMLEKYPDSRFIDTTECIGDRLTIYYPE